MKKERLNKKKNGIGMLSFLLALIVFSTSSFVNINFAMAGISLPHIEQIIGEKSTFNILEIIPEKDSGSMGYYADGQEPDADWLSDIADIKGTAARTEYADAKFMALNDAGLLNSSGTAPLQLEKWDDIGSKTIYYSEMLPWEKEEDEQWETLTLNQPESVTLTGTFLEHTNGEYMALYEYKLNLETGGYIQQVGKLTYGNQTDKMFYYKPVFEPIESGTDITHLTGKAVYTCNADGIYELQGIIGKMDGLDVEKKYFYIGEVGTPFEAFDALNAPYAATEATFVSASPGYFTREKAGYEYCKTGGDYTFNEGVGIDKADVKYNYVRYMAGYSNNNWFQKKVFNLDESQLSGISINVNSVVASDVSAADVNGADLIYISAGFLPGREAEYYSEANDLSADTALAIYSNVAKQCPVIIDYSLVDGIGTGTTSMLNIQKLAFLCLQGGLSTAEYDVFGDVEINWMDMVDLNSDTDRTFVNGNVYCFYPFSTQYLSGVADANAMVTPNFELSFASSVYNDGFAAVLSEIKNENFYRQVAGDSNRFEEAVSIANSVRYIINYSNRRVVDAVSRVRVLEIQPAKVSGSQVLSKATVLNWLGTGTTLTTDDINITTMTSSEFIGKIENINEEYDLVYIGASTAGMNVYGGETVYNDGNMDGIIYSSIGDVYLSDIGMAGLLDRDYLTTSDGRQAIDATSTSKANTFRFSGNDITEVKVNDIEDFANAGYPVVIDNKLFNVSNVVDTNTVDNSSFMYNALDGIKGYDNVMNVTIASSNNGKVIKYLGVSKPQITLTSFPTEYAVDSYAGTTTSMETEEDGYYYLEYIFSIKNATDAAPAATTYDCGLYLDLNADGRYIQDEKLTDVEVYENDNESLILPTENGGEEIYSLSAGAKYKIRRQMPDGFVGIIPWKLEIVKNEADHIHAAVHKYTRIAAGENKEKIKVLQITKKDSSGSLLNLEEQLKTGTTYNTQLRGKDGKYYKGIYGKLIADLDDFDIDITTLETNELAAFGNSSIIYNELDKYDMLIIGFADTYQDVGEQSASAIVNYIESGRSVLFTHDTTSHQNIPNSSYPVVTVAGSSDTPVTITAGPWSTSGGVSFSPATGNKLNADVNLAAYGSIYRYQHLEAGDYTMTGTITIPTNSSYRYVYVGITDNGRLDQYSRYRTTNNNAKTFNVDIDFTMPSAGSPEIYIWSDSKFSSGKYVQVRNLAITKNGSSTEETTIGDLGNIGYWGYYFNTIIRDAVGLDRYGITSTTMAEGSTIKSIIKGHGDEDDYLTPDQIKSIEDGDYSVAFKPNSNGSYTVAETQGYTNYELIRYGKSGQKQYTNNSYSTRETGYVSQVNEGQITTYPYDVNTTSFGGDISGSLGGTYMTVGNTHEQYFQLNMNSDDIVVWYCLSSGSLNDSNYYYDDSPNDAINAYYIYNKGNVTYSGVGHTAGNEHYTGSSISTAFVNEAQLFVNTMIASYNSGSQAPTVSIKDGEAGTNDLHTKYFTMEYNMDETTSVLESAFSETNENRAVYFKVSDPNLDESKTIALSYYYSKDGGTTMLPFVATTLYAKGATAGIIKGGVVYKIYLSDEVLNTLAAEDVNVVQLYVNVTTTIGEKTLTGRDSLDLRKVGLFHLK